MTAMSRRRLLQGGGLAVLAALLPPELLAGCTTSTATLSTSSQPPTTHPLTSAPRTLLVFDAHEAAVVTDATARLIPGPMDDPAEAGHPGAREANVTRYIDTLLGALSVTPQAVFAGGPFSNRAGNATDDMARFIGLGPAEAAGWKLRLASYQAQYRRGVPALDRLAGGDFTTASDDDMDAVLVKDPGGFVTLMFGHAIEAMYSCPEYGGNEDLVGWIDIKFPGDCQPRGYTPSEVTNSDGPDAYVPDGSAAELLGLMRASSGK
jgi:hypothetical protein